MTNMKLFFVDSDTLMGYGAKFFGKIKTGSAKFTHCGFIIDDILTVEALLRGVRSRDFKKVYAKSRIIVFKLPGIPGENHEKLRIELQTMVGKLTSLYGFFRLPFQMGDAIVSYFRKKPTFFFTKIFKSKWFPICSYLVGWCLYKYGNVTLKALFKLWRSLSPDDIIDIIIKYPTHFPIDTALSTVNISS